MSKHTNMSTPSQDAGVLSSYILMVQHLIECCLLFFMDRHDCATALAEYANIQPEITLTVWNELEKENEHFFQDYFSKRQERRSKLCEGLIVKDATTKLQAMNVVERKDTSSGLM